MQARRKPCDDLRDRAAPEALSAAGSKPAADGIFRAARAADFEAVSESLRLW